MGRIFSRDAAQASPALEKSPLSQHSSVPVSFPSEETLSFSSCPADQERVQQVVVIGGGATGLGALKIIVDTPQVREGRWNVTLYEKRADIGGIWLPGPAEGDLPETPLYDTTSANIPHAVFAFPSLPYPPGTPLFPSAAQLQSYLKGYAAHFNLLPHIQTNMGVSDVRRTQNNKRWVVTLANGDMQPADLVVVANGHYHVPKVPDTNGLYVWLANGRASHAVRYRHPLPQDKGAKVMVVGAGASGNDISQELAGAADTVIRSVTGGAGSLPASARNMRIRPRASEYRTDGTVVFEDGTVEHNVDRVVLATGYTYSFPFLDSVMRPGLPPDGPRLPNKLINTGASVFGLAQDIWALTAENVPPHTLAFVGLAKQVLIYPWVEDQARAIVRAFANPETLDLAKEKRDLVARSERLKWQLGPGATMKDVAREWHVTGVQEQWDARDAMNVYAGDVSGRGEPPQKVAPFVKELAIKSGLMRLLWRELEAQGVADQWVRGVGEKGVQEWATLMRKLLRRAYL